MNTCDKQLSLFVFNLERKERRHTCFDEINYGKFEPKF